METTTKEVYFSEYCHKCKYSDVHGFDEPCNTCLEHPSNENSHKPVNWKEKTNE